MESELTLIISSLSMLMSGVAIFITFRKDAHRMKLHLINGNYNDKITIHNDSQAKVQLQAVGVIDSSSEIVWRKGCYNSITNTEVTFPTIIEGRTAFTASLRQPDKMDEYAYCIQLSSGRTYVVNSSLNQSVYTRLVFRSIISQLSAGKYGFPLSYVHLDGVYY